MAVAMAIEGAAVRCAEMAHGSSCEASVRTHSVSEALCVRAWPQDITGNPDRHTEWRVHHGASQGGVRRMRARVVEADAYTTHAI